MADAGANFVGTKPVLLKAQNALQIFVVVSDHAVVAEAFGAGEHFVVLEAAKDGLFALANVAEGHAEEHRKLEVGQLSHQFFELPTRLLFLVRNHPCLLANNSIIY